MRHVAQGKHEIVSVQIGSKPRDRCVGCALFCVDIVRVVVGHHHHNHPMRIMTSTIRLRFSCHKSWSLLHCKPPFKGQRYVGCSCKSLINKFATYPVYDRIRSRLITDLWALLIGKNQILIFGSKYSHISWFHRPNILFQPLQYHRRLSLQSFVYFVRHPGNKIIDGQTITTMFLIFALLPFCKTGMHIMNTSHVVSVGIHHDGGDNRIIGP